MKKLISLSLLFALIFTTIVSAASFRDVDETHVFYENIENLKTDGIISGYDDGTFKPDEPVTRGQMAKLISKGLQIDINTKCENFADIDSSQTFYTYIVSLKCHGIIQGFSDNTFRDNEYVTRGAATKFIISAARFIRNDSEYLKGIYTSAFTDVPRTYVFAEYIDGAYTHSLIKGYSDRKFRPENNITRGEISKLIDLIRNKINQNNRCIYYGREYTEGSTFNSADNCNRCACTGGQVRCTFNVCVNTVDYTITMNNYVYSPSVIKAKPGQNLNIKLINQYGYHNLVVDELSIKSQSISTGEETIVQIPIPMDAEGKEFEFYCSTSAHKDRGMVGKIVVEN